MNPDTYGYASVDLTDDEKEEVRMEYSNTMMTNSSITTPLPPPLTSMKNIVEFRKSKTQNIDNISILKSYCGNNNPTSKLSINNTCAEKVTKSLADKAVISQSKKPNGKMIIVRKDNKSHKIVIPYDVLPIINEAVGPVHIEIPNFGYVDIKSDPQFKNQAMDNSSCDQLLPFSVDFERLFGDHEQNQPLKQRKNKQLENHAVRKISPKKSRKKQKRPTTKANTKLCIEYDNYKTHQVTEGFTVLEADEARPCVEYLNTLIKEMKIGLRKQVRKLYLFKRRIQRKNNPKLNTQIPPEICDYQLGKRKIKTRRFSDYLYEENGMKLYNSSSDNVTKSCYVLIERNEYVEALYRRMCAEEALKSNETEVNLKINTISDKFILTAGHFIREMSYIKPLLVINEHNFKILDVKTNFSKANLVCALNEDRLFPKVLLNDDKFIYAVKNNYIKIVDSDLLYGYISGQIGPTRSTLDCVPICKP